MGNQPLEAWTKTYQTWVKVDGRIPFRLVQQGLAYAASYAPFLSAAKPAFDLSGGPFG